MNSFLRQSTASQVRTIGPFLDDTDFKTTKTALTIANTDIKIVVNGGASANKNSGGGTHRANGEYGVTFDATDTATVGSFAVSVVVSGALPVFHYFTVMTAAAYDMLFGSSAIGYINNANVNVNQWLGSSAPANTGDAYARLGAPAGASVAADVASVKTDTSSTSGKFTGITLLAQWLGMLAGKQSGNSTARTEMRATGGGSGTFDETTDSLEAFKDSIATTAQTAAAVSAALQLKKNTALSNYPFTIYLAGTKTPATGKTVTCQKLLDADSAFSSMSSSATEVGATGTYRISLAAADINGNTGTWKFTASGCDPLIIHFVTQS